MTQDINMTQVINDNILYINDNILYIIDNILYIIDNILSKSMSIFEDRDGFDIVLSSPLRMSCNAQCIHGTVHTVRDTVYFAHRIAYIRYILYSIHQLSFVTTKPFLMILYLYYIPWHFPLRYTIHCTLYTIYRTLCTVHYTLYTIYYILYTVHYTLYTVHCTLYTI